MLLENELLHNLSKIIPRHPDQLNKLLESDAELIKIGKDFTIAITTDTIIEEIKVGLYKDPYLIGWMMATSNFSDIAAVGAEPIGLLVNMSISEDLGLDFIQTIYRGIADACDLCGANILGGDTNHAGYLELGGTALGLIRDDRIITRKGCRPGDQLYATGKLGAGGLYAMLQLLPSLETKFSFLPKARIAEGQLIRKIGRICIDTSDSLFPAISNLMELNHFGVKINEDIEALLEDEYLTYMQKTPVQPWFLLAGPHGEFELLFTVDPCNEEELLKKSANINWKPMKIGEIIDEPIMHFSLGGKNISCNPDDISNLYSICGGNIEVYLHALGKQHKQWKQSERNKVNFH
jgi:thiamine-monophosphate kinase